MLLAMAATCIVKTLCHLRREHFAKSDAWKRAVLGFVPALERLPGLSLSEGHYDPSLNPHHEEDDEGGERECAACERLHSRATVELLFKGRPYWPDYKYGTKCVPLRCKILSLSSFLRSASTQQQILGLIFQRGGQVCLSGPCWRLFDLPAVHCMHSHVKETHEIFMWI